MPKDRWVGFIKDYDGGTLMEVIIIIIIVIIVIVIIVLSAICTQPLTFLGEQKS